VMVMVMVILMVRVMVMVMVMVMVHGDIPSRRGAIEGCRQGCCLPPPSPLPPTVEGC
jgi:hypothetical protein